MAIDSALLRLHRACAETSGSTPESGEEIRTSAVADDDDELVALTLLAALRRRRLRG
ncbi:MAG: hypothetical protein ACXVRK_03390 [Gaiellaceae bacterium]